MIKKLLAVSAIAVVGVSGFSAPTNSIFDPMDGGGYNITNFVPVANTTFDYENGTLSDGTTTWTGALETNQSGNVAMWVFRFGNIIISNNVTITSSATSPTRKPGLVLASRTNLTMAGTINLFGVAGSSDGAGAPGGEGGNRKSTYNSSPPPSAGGDGGGQWTEGRGYGAGATPGGQGQAPGAGYGGEGGRSATSTDLGASYGDVLLHDLYGGSGGGGTASGGMFGGGGGGSLELVAVGTLTFSGVISTYGGAGESGTFVYPTGAGSGGGVILAAAILDVTGGKVNAYGGAGSKATAASRGGGGGGGGRVAFYGGISVSGVVPGTTYNVAGGKITALSSAAEDGEHGTIGFVSSTGTVFVAGLNLDEVSIAAFESATNKVYLRIRGTDGTLLSGTAGSLDNGATLRSVTNSVTYYNPVANPGLGGATYLLADLDGNAGQGGELKPNIEVSGEVFIWKTGGTMWIIR